MSISQLARSLKESPTLRLNAEAQRLRDRGEPVINLGIGEPKNRTPIAAILSSTARLRDGNVKYVATDGLPSLKKAIVRYTEENYGRLVAPENVIVSTGAKQALYNVFFSILDPLDEVIVLAPYWVSYPEMIRMVHAVPVIVSPPDDTFQPRLEDIELAVSDRTKAIIVNSPNNPSGVVYDEAFIAQIVDFCERRDIYLLMDDIYHKLVFDGHCAPSAYNFTHRDSESTKVIILNGISKVYGMTGFRIGWAVASRKLVEILTSVQGQITSCPSVVSQAAAEGALNGVQSVVENLRLSIQNNRDVTMNELLTFGGVHVRKPGGTFYCLPDFSVYQRDSDALAAFLLDKVLVVTVPGKEFGMEGHLRLSYSGTAKEVTEGVRRIKWALDPSAPNEIYIGDRKLVRDWL